jgi:sugar phosphate permease
MFLFAVMPAYWMLFLPVAILGAAQALNVPIGQLLLASYVPQDQRAVFFSIYRTMNNIGQALGPLALGAVYYYYGLSPVFYAGGIAGLISSLCYIYLLVPSSRF